MDAQAFYDTANEDAKDWLASQLFYRELETIRRDKPLLDPEAFRVNTLALYDSGGDQGKLRGGAITASPLFLRRQKRLPVFRVRSYSTRFLAKPAKVDLNDVVAVDDDDDDGAPRARLPSPSTPMRRDIPQISRNMGYTKPFGEQFRREAEAAKTDFLTTGYDHGDQESMFQGSDWLPYLQHPSRKSKSQILYKGFPMVENVVFVKHPNYWTEIETQGKLVESGQCYWLAIALLLYGNADFWVRVKAEHLKFLHKVLANPKHPRYSYYSRTNQAEISTAGTGPEGKWQGTTNLWEMLQMPGCWTSDDVCSLTADVYGVFLVLYKYNSKREEWKDKVYDMKTYGAYNSRHLFLCYTEERHYQPMVPNEYYAYEFKLPRITLRSTQKYRLLTGPRRRHRRDGPGHHWRAPSELIPPPLSLPSFEPEHLTRVVGYGPYEVKPALPEPEPPSQRQAETQTAPAKSPSVTERRGSVTQADVQAAQAQAAKQAALEALEVAKQYVQGVDAGRRPLPRSRPTSAPAGTSKRPAIEPAEGESQAKRSRVSPPPHTRPGPSAADDADPAGPSPSFTPINAPRSRSQSVIAQPGPSGSTNENDGTFFKTLTQNMLKMQKVKRLRKWCADLDFDADEAVMNWKKDQCVAALLGRQAEVRMRKRGRGEAVVGEEEEAQRWLGNMVRLPAEEEEEEDVEEEEQDEQDKKKGKQKGKEKAVEKSEKGASEKERGQDKTVIVIGDSEDDDDKDGGDDDRGKE
ncbi:hypothetical protein C8A03DRAFT_17181 [Achaetomium macrosporum]|uniref:Uncharacterized protein n=1 Tax=Achaetomium macrosporum TaxID=79813 RepID=A0AAN7C662_9PEZI|nr:hypothetical protein C8A03DRAFT_17181 [Achaetomium macrosporum]